MNAWYSSTRWVCGIGPSLIPGQGSRCWAGYRFILNQLNDYKSMILNNHFFNKPVALFQLLQGMENVLRTNHGTCTPLLSWVYSQGTWEKLFRRHISGFWIIPRRSKFHLQVSDQTLCFWLKVVNPSIADSITKLLFLSPKDILWQIRIIWIIKSLPECILLHAISRHFARRFQVHGIFHEFSIQKWDPFL